jgi:hypothetical protein
MIWVLNFHRFCRDVPVYATRRPIALLIVVAVAQLTLCSPSPRPIATAANLPESPMQAEDESPQKAAAGISGYRVRML